MFDRTMVNEALKLNWEFDYLPKSVPFNPKEVQDTAIALLIYEVFGGEILKTSKNKIWHFYNRIDGRRVDFTRSKLTRLYNGHPFEDILSTPEETFHYIEQDDYLTFFTKFILAFEIIVGLGSHSITTSS